MGLDMADPPGGGLGFATEPADTTQRAVYEFLGLARFLLAETPSRAERASADVPEIREIVERGSGVVRWYDPDEPRYISVRNGIRTTSKDLPSWADPSDVIEMAPLPPPGRDLFLRLKRLADQISQRDPHRYDLYRMAETVSAIEKRNEHVDVHDAVAFSEISASEDVLDVRADVPFDLAPFRRAVDYAFREYHGLRLSGAGARDVFALDALMEVAGPLAGQAVTIAKQLLRQTFAEGIVPTQRWVLSLVDLGLWMDAFDMATDGGAWIPAASAGRICLSKGDSYRDAARGEPTFEQFHRALYVALAFYRAAAWLFGVVEWAGPAYVRQPVLEEAIDSQRVCEEMRARIETSLAWAADVNSMGYNLTHPQRLEDWVLSLPQEPAEGARAEISDLSSQLAFPDFVREVALALLDLVQERPERAVRRAASVVAMMEARLGLVAEWGLGYFAYSAKLARAGLRFLGREEEARYFDQRLDADWLRERISLRLLSARLSHLRGGVFPGQPDGVEFLACRLVRVRCLKSGGDEDSAEQGRHVAGGRLGLRRVPR
jgi:hypothetical protein